MTAVDNLLFFLSGSTLLRMPGPSLSSPGEAPTWSPSEVCQTVSKIAHCTSTSARAIRADQAGVDIGEAEMVILLHVQTCSEPRAKKIVGTFASPSSAAVVSSVSSTGFPARPSSPSALSRTLFEDFAVLSTQAPNVLGRNRTVQRVSDKGTVYEMPRGMEQGHTTGGIFACVGTGNSSLSYDNICLTGRAISLSPDARVLCQPCEPLRYAIKSSNGIYGEGTRGETSTQWLMNVYCKEAVPLARQFSLK